MPSPDKSHRCSMSGNCLSGNGESAVDNALDSYWCSSMMRYVHQPPPQRIAAMRAEACAIGAELAAQGAAMGPEELFEVTGDLQGAAERGRRGAAGRDRARRLATRSG